MTDIHPSLPTNHITLVKNSSDQGSTTSFNELVNMSTRIALWYLIWFATLALSSSRLKSGPLQVVPSNTLLERSSDAHNYAIVCIYDKRATAFCMKYYGYSCNSLGKKISQKFDHDCDVLCSCVDLYPAPRCFVGLTGEATCLRSLHELGASGNFIDGGEANPSIGIFDSSKDLSTVDSAQSVNLPAAVPTQINSGNLLASDNFRLVTFCTRDDITVVTCWNAGESHDLLDRVATPTPDPRTQPCAPAAACFDMFFKLRCSISQDFALDCDQHGEIEELVNPRLLDILNQKSTLALRRFAAPKMLKIPTTHPPHNYALVCSNDRVETQYCQDDGYYCDSLGSVQLRAQATANRYCIDNCKCNKIALYHMVDRHGASYLMDSQTIYNVLSLDQFRTSASTFAE